MIGLKNIFDHIKKHSEYDWYESNIQKPFFKNWSVKYLIWEDGQIYENSDRELDDFVSLTFFAEETGSISSNHKVAYQHLLDNTLVYKEKIEKYLSAISIENIKYAEDQLEDDFINLLDEIKSAYNLNSKEGLIIQCELSSIGISDNGPNNSAVIWFNFNCGWDEEHGISLLFHDGNLIASGGSSDFSNRGNDVMGHVKIVREFDRFPNLLDKA